jgi:hypothetical protein
MIELEEIDLAAHSPASANKTRAGRKHMARAIERWKAMPKWRRQLRVIEGKNRKKRGQ